MLEAISNPDMLDCIEQLPSAGLTVHTAKHAMLLAQDGGLGDWLETLVIVGILLLGALQSMAGWLIEKFKGQDKNATGDAARPQQTPPAQRGTPKQGTQQRRVPAPPRRRSPPRPQQPASRPVAKNDDDDGVTWLELLTDEDEVTPPPPPARRPVQTAARRSAAPVAIPVAVPVNPKSRRSRKQSTAPVPTGGTSDATPAVDNSAWESLESGLGEEIDASPLRKSSKNKLNISQLRQAIVWSEILAPPIALRDDQLD